MGLSLHPYRWVGSRVKTSCGRMSTGLNLYFCCPRSGLEGQAAQPRARGYLWCQLQASSTPSLARRPALREAAGASPTIAAPYQGGCSPLAIRAECFTLSRDLFLLLPRLLIQSLLSGCAGSVSAQALCQAHAVLSHGRPSRRHRGRPSRRHNLSTTK